jgi:hypothetical protein
MPKDKQPRRQTGAYQNGKYLGGPGTPPAQVDKFVAGRDTGAYQNGKQIGGAEPSSDTQSTDSGRSSKPAGHRKPSLLGRILGRGKKG